MLIGLGHIAKRILEPKFLISNWRKALKIAIPGVFCFTIYWATFPLHRYKLGYFHTDRIGHFVMDAAIKFAETGSKTPRREIYWLESNEPANNFWLTLVRRSFRTTTSSFLGAVVEFARALPINPKWYVAPYRDLNGSRDFNGSLAKGCLQMEFTQEENKQGQDWLASIGCLPGQPFACLMVRDSKYLDSDPIHNPALHGLPKDYWSYHNYRDSDITSFGQAAEWLASQGVFVLRMGKSNAEKFDSCQSQIIDYSFRQDRSDFLDVWLFANCSVCVSTGTGPDAISIAYGRPTIHVNFLPLSQTWTSTRSLTAGKALYNQAGERLSLQETLEADFYTSEDYSSAEIRIRDLSPEELLEVVQEGWARITGMWAEDDRDKIFKEEFQVAIQNSKVGKYHGYLHPEARLSSRWLYKLKEERRAFESGSEEKNTKV